MINALAYQLSIIAIFLYGLFLMFLFVYSLVQLNLAIRYTKMKRFRARKPEVTDDELPVVTVQLPVYNELYVIERLIDAVCALEYPTGKLEIQVLDDSTDESFDVAAKRIAYWKEKGIDIKHIKRPERKGFKAGALAYGLDICRGEFTAIFDADFLPRKDFLMQTMPFFSTSDKIGVVQTRWEHLNEDYSLLTRLQAFGLDAHFTVEQVGRNTSDHFINFNGTAGIWRKSTIYDAGGWESDTITEDLDLSYRAQLRGWEFIYLPNIGSPSELPAEMNALKAQQFRWTKGAAECTVKNLPKVLKAKNLTFGQKVHGAFHLMNSVVFLCILGTSLLSVPMLIIKNTYGDLEIYFKIASVFLVSFFFLGFFYYISRPEGNFFKKFTRFIWEYPTFLSVSMGLSLHNAIAVMEGFTGKKSAFVRTPKFAIGGQSNDKKSETWTDKKYRAIKVSPLTVFEFMMCLYFAFGIYYAINFTGRKEQQLAQVQQSSSHWTGSDFWFTYYAGDDKKGKEAHAVQIQSSEDGKGVIQSKKKNWSLEVSWKANTPATFVLPIDSVAEYNAADDAYFVDALHLETDVPVQANLIKSMDEPTAMIPLASAASFAAQYTIPEAAHTSDQITEFSIIANEDSTWITVTPTSPLFQGNPANQPYSVMLNKGDIHNVLAKNDEGLNGSTVVPAANHSAKSFGCYAGSAPRPHDFGLLGFHIMLTLGYAFVTFFSLKHARA